MVPHFRHKAFNKILKPFIRAFLFCFYGYHAKVYKELKDNYLIISNHVTQIDPIMLSLSFKNPIYFVASDDIFSIKFVSFLLEYFMSPISKAKNEIDISTTKNIISMMKNGGSVGIFISGNATYSGVEEYIPSPIARLVKRINKPLILYNITGCYGVAPRWGDKLRKGKCSGQIKRIILPDEYNNMTDEELEEIIKNEINVDALENNEREYDCKNRAHFLERTLFVCPDCGSIGSLKSEGHNIICEKCGYEAEYQKDLTFKLLKGKTYFHSVKQWYDYQKGYLYDFDYDKYKEDDPIKIDNNVYFVLNHRLKHKEILISKGQSRLYKDRIEIEKDAKKITLDFSDIKSMSVQGKNKLLIHLGDKYYQIRGNKRRSGVLYMFIYYSLKNKKEGKYNGFLGI